MEIQSLGPLIFFQMKHYIYSMKQIFSLIIICHILLGCKGESSHEKVEGISGEYYDWTITNEPEQPWKHDYNRTLVTKFFLCERDSEGNVGKVHLTFKKSLEAIRKLNNITLGIPKIVYLVGWQYNGHDSKYPAWGEVNNALKRKEDKDALTSLKWLIKEAKKYNTIVSLHLNMIDAFPDSPLWDTYLKEDIIAKDLPGNPIPGEVFWGMQSYQISYAQEWKLGFAQKRIDEIIKMIPELVQGGTIHIDAFHSMRPSGPDEPISPYLGYSIEDEMSAQRKILRYWRSKGLDVTCEAGIYWLRRDPFLGLQAMQWHYTESNFMDEDWLNKPHNFKFLPPSLAGYTPMPCEMEIKKDPESLGNLIEQVCLKLVPWYYRRNTDISKYSSIILTEDKVIAPVLWQDHTVIAYSKNENIQDVAFTLPSIWGQVENVHLFEITLEGLKKISTSITEESKNGLRQVILNIPEGQAVVIKPGK